MERDGRNNQFDKKMKKVVKVSIGNIAFTLEESAHDELKGYLDSLELYYGPKEDGAEIVEGIEERIAELLVEKGYSKKVVTLEVVKEIMSVLGRPEEIESEADTGCGSDGETPRKKLFRDLENKKLGGVCSGIARYFGIDPSAVRIITFVFAAVTAFASEGSGLGLFVLLYFAMWAIIPGAKTVEDKCRMRGEGTTVGYIEKKVTEGVNEVVNSDLGQTFKKVLYILVGSGLLLFGFLGLGVMAFLAFGIAVFDAFSILSGVSPVMSAVINILMIMVIVLPFVGMLYGGIMLLFGFKAPKWKPGLVNFLVWFVSCIALSCCLIIASSDYWDLDTRQDVEYISTPADTVYVRYANVDKYDDMQIFVNADRDEYDLFYYNPSKEMKSVVAYPEFQLSRHANGEYRIKSKCEVFTRTLSVEEWQGADTNKLYDYKDNVLTLYPMQVDRERSLKMVDREVTLYIPEEAVVIVEKPIYHNFFKKMEFSDIKFLKNRYWD